LDLSKAELAGDLRAVEKLLTGDAPGAPRWAVLAGNYIFDAAPAEFELLARVANLAERLSAPFLAGISERVLGFESLGETPDADDWDREPGEELRAAWQALRECPAAAWAGLALPRFLLRLPYGKDAASTDAFAFEEMTAPPIHEAYLWGNPAIACALLLGQAFSDSGWEFRPESRLRIDGLPAHAWKQDGEWRLTPCAETLLGSRAVERILDEGLMPLLSIQGSDSVRLARFQSIAAPAEPLAGRWG
jgi:type VI secretion system protein ImpC